MIETLRRSAAHVFVQSLETPNISTDDQHHLLKVLRVKATDQITVSNGVGAWITATITKDGDVCATSELFVIAMLLYEFLQLLLPATFDWIDVLYCLFGGGLNYLLLQYWLLK